VRIIVYITAYSQVLPTTVWTQRSIKAKGDQFQRTVFLWRTRQIHSWFLISRLNIFQSLSF